MDEERSQVEDNDKIMDNSGSDDNDEDGDGCCSDPDEYEYNDASDDEYPYSASDGGDDASEVRWVDSDADTDFPSVEFSMKSIAEVTPTLDGRIRAIAEPHQLLPSVAHALLRHHRWNEERLTDALLASKEDAVEAAGVSARHAAAANGDIPTTLPPGTCPICMEDTLPLLQMACRHPFCTECWTQYLTTAVSSGNFSTVDRLTCPQYKCHEFVTHDEVSSFSPHLLRSYRTLQLQSFVDKDPTSRWCPGADCQRIAVGTTSVRGTSCTVVTCDSCTCTRGPFCLWCGEEPHAPLRCDELRLWKEKNRDESETANWILKNTKKCRACGKHIEKNQGCNHMTCKCGYEFCWICETEWSVHNGSHFKCNMYVEGDEKKNGGDKERAAIDLDKYLHYYGRYHAHEDAQAFAQKQLVGETGRLMQNFSEETNVSWNAAQFLNAANLQLVECRRVLKYTYGFAYYMKDKALITEVWAELKIHQGSERSLNGGGGKLPSGRGGGIKRQSSVKSQKGSGKSLKKTGMFDGPGNMLRQFSKGRNGLGFASLPARNTLQRHASVESNNSCCEEEVAKRQKEVFEDHQHRLEAMTEELSEMVEMPVEKIDREGIINKTRIVEKYVGNILQYVEEEF